MKRILFPILGLILALGLTLPMAMPAMASTSSTQVSRPGIAAWGPVTAYTPLSGAWGTTGSAVVTWKHPSWPLIPSSSAVWISTAFNVENARPDSWRRFQDTINIPAIAYNIQVSVLTLTADNAEEVYWNGTLVGSDGEIQGPFVDNSEWQTLRNYTVPAGSATPGVNNLDFIVRNYAYNTDNPQTNPTGLIYKVTVTYDLAVLTSLTPAEAFNAIGTTHTVTATITPAVAGVPVTFTVTGANTDGDTFNTNASGVAAFPYTGTNPGQDTITATVGDGTPISVTKYWLDNFVTGGGTIKVGKTVTWTFGGNVGYLPDGTLVGQFQIVDHANKISYHSNNNFNSLVFSDTEAPAESPTASHDTATFTGTFTNNKDATTKVITVTIQDLGEPGAGVDKITLTGDLLLAEIIISGGNFQVHPPALP